MFDARSAKALKPGDHLIVEDAPGLRLVATAKLRTWTYRYKSPVDGRMRQVRLGHWPAVGLPAALAAWERQRQQRAAGSDPAAEKRTQRAAAAAASIVELYTVREACNRWLAAYHGTVEPKTYAEAARLLRHEIDEVANRPAASLRRGDCYSLIDGKRHKPVVAATLRRVLGAVWDRALDAGELPDETPNWWRQILRGKMPSKGKAVGGVKAGPVKRALTELEVGQLLRWMPNFSRDVADALTLYLWTACRGAEIVKMERAEVSEELDGLWWTIPRGKLKMRRNALTVDLRVPLIGRAEAIVRRRLAASSSAGGYVFPSRGASGHIEQKAIGVATWTHRPECSLRPEYVRPRLPIANWAPHDLRRTSRTMLAAIGCPDGIAEAILGHLPPGIQAVYNRHGYDPERRLWLTQLAARLESCAAPARAAAR